MDIEFDYYKFRENKVVGKINNELSFYETHSEYVDYHPFCDYITYLKGRLGIHPISTTKPQSSYSMYGSNYGFKTMVINDYNKDIDEVTFSRPWNKLRELHKVIKINEFIKQIPYKDNLDKKKVNDNRAYLIDEICKGLKNKCFTKNKSVIDYNQTTMVIESISCLTKGKHGLYIIDWKK